MRVRMVPLALPKVEVGGGVVSSPPKTYTIMANNKNQTGVNYFGPYSSTLDGCLADSDGLIYFGRCTGTPPTTADIFAHGCRLVQTDSGTGNLAEWTNSGSSAVPSWNIVQALGSAVTSAVPSETYVVKTTLSAANILNLNGTPITIAAAPGAGKVIIVENVAFTFNPGTTTYTGVNTLEARYTGDSGVKVLTDVVSTFINTGSGSIPLTYVENGLSTNMLAGINSPVVVVVPSSNPAAGNGTMVISTKYRIASLT